MSVRVLATVLALVASAACTGTEEGPPALDAESPGIRPSDRPTQIVDDPADANPRFVDLRRVKVVAAKDELEVTWTANAPIPEEPDRTLYFALDVDRFDAAGNGDTWQVAANWPGDGWIAHVFPSDAGQVPLDGPVIDGRTITVTAPWGTVGDRETFKWKAAAETGDGINNDRVRGHRFPL